MGWGSSVWREVGRGVDGWKAPSIPLNRLHEGLAMEDLEVNRRLVIPSRSLRMETSTATGPGGQRLNRVRTRVTLIYDVTGCSELGETRRDRLLVRLAHRITQEGHLSVRCGRHRRQSDNISEARKRLSDVIREALAPVRARKATRPTRASRTRRMDAKSRKGAQKKHRGWTWGSDS
jgi:ribosome-associated protein